MNRRKINSMILALGTAAALGLTGNVEAKAAENNASVSYEAKLNLASASKAEKQQAVSNINKTGGTVKDYVITLGITSVNTDNIDHVKKAVSIYKEKRNRDLVESEILNAVKDAVGVDTLFQYIEEDMASDMNYIDLGIEGVDESNVEEFNTLLKNKKYYVLEEVQNYINLINESLDNINQGRGEVKDYKNIEISTEVTEQNKDAVNKTVLAFRDNKKGNLNISEIGKAAENGVNNYDALEKVNKGEADLQLYEKLGVNKVTENNLMFINQNLKGKKLWNADDIQAEVDSLVDVYKSFSRFSEGTASLEDYKATGIFGVTEENLVYVNADLIGKNFLTVKEAADYVNKNSSIYTSLSKVNNGTASLDDYKILECTYVSNNDLDFVNNKLKNSQILKVSDVQKAVSKQLEVKEAISNIKDGHATLSDYEKLNAIGVKEENLKYVNDALKGKINDYGTNLQILLNNILGSYSIINNVNEGKEIKDEQGFVKEYKDLVKIEISYDTSAKSELSIIRNCVKIKRKLVGGRQLTTEEIAEIINSVHSNLEDSRVVVAKINKEIEKTEAVAERELTADEEKNLIDNVISSIKYAVRRIYVGAAKVEDFRLFDENRVNEFNIEVVNKDIAEFKEISKLSSYRLEGITEEVSKALAVYNINRDNLNKDSNGLVKEFALLGKEVQYDYKNGSLLRVTEDLIVIRRKEKGETLSRNEILAVLDEVQNNLPKYKVLIPKISDKIFLEENNKGRDLTKEEVNEIINNVEKETKDVVSRLVLGEGKVEDYILYGEDRVNSDNLSVVNEYIKVYGEVSKTSNYDVIGLKEAVDKGIAIYNLNNGIETVSLNGRVKELETIGIIVESSNDSNSIDKKIMSKIKEKRASENNRYLNKDDILKIVAEAKKPAETPKPVEPKKKTGFFDRVKDWFKNIFGF